MSWIPLHQAWQIYPLSMEHSCLEYCYTKFGRSTGRSSPLNWASMPGILSHQTWQIYPSLIIDALNTITPNLADLPIIDHRCIEYHYTKLGWYTGRSTPSSKHRCLEYHYTKLGRSTHCQLSTDALNTITPNLADLLTNLPPSSKHRCLEYHYTKLCRSTGRSTPSINWA